MKSITLFYLISLICLQLSGQSGEVHLNIVLQGEKPEKISLSKLDFESSRMEELKSVGRENASEQVVFRIPFYEAGIFELESENGKKIRFAIEKAGTIRIDLGESFVLKSELASELNFDKEIQSLNARIFGKLIQQYETAMANKDQETIEKLEKQKDLLLLDFVREMEALVRNMGPSAKAYDALGYFDLFKNQAFILEMTEDFKEAFPQAEMTLALERSLEAAKKTSVGSKVPEFSSPSLEGLSIRPDSYKGKYLLLDFWASWCKACRVENPKFVQLYDQYKGKGFEILSISIDSSEDLCKEAIAADGLKWTQILDPNMDLYKQFFLSSLPSNFLLDEKGIIIARNLTAEQLRIQLEGLK